MALHPGAQIIGRVLMPVLIRFAELMVQLKRGQERC
jgi:hypothetical protein